MGYINLSISIYMPYYLRNINLLFTLIMKLQLKTEIKNWYLSEYPTDEEGVNLKWGITFLDLFKHLDTKDKSKNIYDFIFNDSFGDSLIRERLFSALAEIFKTDYNYIYNKWLSKEYYTN